MKLLKIYLLVFITFFIAVSNTTAQENLKFGLMMITQLDTSWLKKYYDPFNSSSSCNSMMCFTYPTTEPEATKNLSDFQRAMVHNLHPIIAILNRDDVVNNRWDAITLQLDIGSNNGADWFYIDDCVSGEPQILGDKLAIVKSLIQETGDYKLATSEYHQAALLAHEVEINNYIDVLMPYSYNKSSLELDAFYSTVKTHFPGRKIVPFLGYFADYHNNGAITYFSQTGNRGLNHTGHIEVAKKYATENLIYYYLNRLPYPSGTILDNVIPFLDSVKYISEYLKTFYSPRQNEIRAAASQLNSEGWSLYQSSGGLPTFTTMQAATYWNVTAMTYGDYDGDGRDEMVTAYSSPDHFATQLQICKQEGSTVSAKILYNKSGSENDGYYFTALASGDFNGNGKDELRATASKAGTLGYRLYEGGDGEITENSLTSRDIPYWNVTAITYGDYDGDGRDERVTAFTIPGHSQTQVQLEKSDYSGNYSSAMLYNVTDNNNGKYFTSLASGDFNGNGKEELRAAAMQSNEAGYWLYQSGDGSVPSSISLSSRTDYIYNITAMTYGDYDGDGRDEIVTAYSRPSSPESIVKIEDTGNYGLTNSWELYHTTGPNIQIFTALASGHALREDLSGITNIYKNSPNISNKYVLTSSLLTQNYPNPFNPSTRISYSIPEKDFVSVKVFNTLGQEISTLVNEVVEAGTHSIDFDGSSLPSGMYIYQIQTSKMSQAKKMLLVK